VLDTVADLQESSMTTQPHTLSNAMRELHGAFGADIFGRRAEAFARMFGTPRFLVIQTIVVAVWIALNAAAVSLRWDPYPFILLNLAFSLQAAYAAPLILLAQTRQADREKAINEADTNHRETLAAQTIDLLENAKQQTIQLHELLDLNTRLTEEVNRLTTEIHRAVTPSQA
jgi:uncharacterized membrane protein